MKLKSITFLFICILMVSCSSITSSFSSTESSSINSSISTSSSTSSSSSDSSSANEETYIKLDLVRNGSFDTNIQNWNVYNGGGNVVLSFDNSTLKADITCGLAIYEPRIDQMNIAFEQGKIYMIEYKARTNMDNKDIQIQAGQLLNNAPWFVNFGLAVRDTLTREWQIYNHKFYHSQSNINGGIIFEIGYSNSDIKEYEIYFDDIVIYEVIGGESTFSDLTKVEGDAIVTNVPTIYLTTENNAQIPADKTVLINGTFTLKDKQEFLNIQNKPMKIRGRGNSTLFMPKMPYKIEFEDAIDLYGIGKNKDWILLANYADKSLIRNYLTFNFAESLVLEFTPSSIFVEVYLNEQYNGVYMLTTQIETGVKRVNIETDYTSSDIQIPFLLEWDRRLVIPNENDGARLDIDYFTIDGIPFGMDYPKTLTEITTNQRDYIREYIRLTNNAIMNNYRYDQYIDTDSFIDYFIVQELFKNVDMGFSSVYLYKTKTGKLKLGPVWDFDLALGNADYIDYGPFYWFSSQYNGNIWFYTLMKDPGFYNRFVMRFNEIKDNQIADLIDSVDIIGRDIYSYAKRNFERWLILGKYDWPNPIEVVQALTYDDQVYYVKNYLIERVKWMDEELNS